LIRYTAMARTQKHAVHPG